MASTMCAPSAAISAVTAAMTAIHHTIEPGFRGEPEMLTARQRELMKIVMSAILPGWDRPTFDEWCAAMDELYPEQQPALTGHA